MVIQNVVHPKIASERLFILKRWHGRDLYVQSIDGTEREKFDCHCIKFQFNFQGVKITQMKFLVRLVFASTVHNA